VVKRGGWYQLALSQRERRERSRSREEGVKEKKEEGRRKGNMMCTYLRIKLDHRSARPRKIRYKVYKVCKV
jgi:hypothetical protein